METGRRSRFTWSLVSPLFLYINWFTCFYLCCPSKPNSQTLMINFGVSYIHIIKFTVKCQRWRSRWLLLCDLSTDWWRWLMKGTAVINGLGTGEHFTNINELIIENEPIWKVMLQWSNHFEILCDYEAELSFVVTYQISDWSDPTFK